MKKLLVVFVVLILLAGAGIIYLVQPKNLGIKYSAQDHQAFNNKIKVSHEELPADSPSGKTLIASGNHPVDETFSSEELSAAADNRHKDYVYFPFHKVQIRVNSDGSVEGSASVSFQDAVNYLLALGVNSADISEGTKKFKIPNASLPVYLKVSGSVENNTSRISVQQAKIANIGVPQNLIDEYGPGLNDLVNSVISDRQPSYNVEKLEAVGGKVHFKGTSPDREQSVRSK
ncbi:hypothetical protein A3B48_02745 [Candidatus Gottesmanbacteria bacterium RIFCSPLOWO2_01_FULL_40_10]|uniref:Uncharacterized protein n=1 Tax=Candidatus Gottesmanbacteria bacterium RIFCSPHIGHO2_01_FULL_40_15 TaxID=1798376 RepID=A0A1F5Z7H0_9BACT|nr:MAG: hypothetical protein A2777_01715 [Candidatus Gottesmanbacteria bacterium RIFCSPHIGHO2_01_FULL_40_15]OGG20771.1 MAG: hypothetical protein A3B48_02745 [Candidatus Gottesmanbacteria bacterium RIFCSPLOWO2_01_FULL_40_10]OGG25520.1 MAG: hypothetical protein A3E42_04225 [Candidatus Gottesmanbacteria bacterium RIFCSPHIGHO2_12_FULL_40_13]